MVHLVTTNLQSIYKTLSLCFVYYIGNDKSFESILPSKLSDLKSTFDDPSSSLTFCDENLVHWFVND
jgi:hypothetical protein